MNPLTINAPIPFGLHRDGSVAAAELRRKSAVLVGEPDSGKSVGLHCLAAGLFRCPDAIVMGIDLGGAGFIAPWLSPWLDDGATRPVFDAVAPDVDEALFLTQFLLDVIQVRRVIYRDHMRRNNSDVLPLSPDVPGILLLVDESAEAVGLTGHPRLQSNVIRINQLGRFVGVRCILTALRATTDVIPKPAMTSIGARIGMGVADEAELHYLFGWKLKIDAGAYPYPGCGLWRPKNSGPPPEKFRFFNLSEPESLERIAWAVERWRPELDLLTLDAVERLTPGSAAHWAARWERVLPRLTGDGLALQGSPAQPPGGAPAASAGSRPGPGLSLANPAQAQGGLDLARLQAKIDAARRAVAAERQLGSIEDQFARIAGQLADDRAAGGEGWADGRQLDDARAAALHLLDQAGPEGLSGPRVHELLVEQGAAMTSRTVYRWLAADAIDAGYGRYVHPKFREQK